MEYKGKIKNLVLNESFIDCINDEISFNYKIITDNYYHEELPIITHIYINDFFIYELKPLHIRKISGIYLGILNIKNSIDCFISLNNTKEAKKEYIYRKNLEILQNIFQIKEQMLFDISLDVIENKMEFLNDMLGINISSNGSIIFIVERILENMKYGKIMFGKFK